jgi:fluoride exporter
VPRTALVAFGGLIGSVARYWLTGLVQRLHDTAFPVGTLTVNVIGSFLVALVMALSLDRGLMNATTRTFLTVGFCGGFTTMSTFSYETVALLRSGDTVLALGNVAATMGVTLIAVWLGDLLARVL